MYQVWNKQLKRQFTLIAKILWCPLKRSNVKWLYSNFFFFFFVLLPAMVDFYFIGSIHVFVSYRVVVAVVVNVINTLKSLFLSRSHRMFGVDNFIVFETYRTFHFSQWINARPHPLFRCSRARPSLLPRTWLIKSSLVYRHLSEMPLSRNWVKNLLKYKKWRGCADSNLGPHPLSSLV